MTASNSPSTAYDETPYPDLSYAQTHPDRLATLGHILGIKTARVEQCRVLELGCAGGGNLLPMAANLPRSHFVGIDFSPHQIEIGQQRIRALDLANLHLLCLDVREVAERDGPLPDALQGEFDYIIAHGLYSWVKRPVRDALLSLCKQILAPNGIVYISYNTLPGWNITRIVREAMLFHARDADTPQEITQRAREIVKFLADHVPDEHDAYRGIFRQYQTLLMDGMKGANEAFLLHDELEEVNEPVYFQDFVEHAAQFGLRYFVETELANVLPHLFGPEVMAKLQEMATTPTDLEQYMDFLRNRMFRQSLLCHAEINPTRMLDAEPIMDCYIRSNAQPERPLARGRGGALRVGQGAVAFRGNDQATLTTDHPLSQAAFTILHKHWPAALHFDALVQAAHATLAPGAPPLEDAKRMQHERTVLAGNLLRGYGHSTGLVNLHRMAPNMAPAPGKRPQAAEIARFEAKTRSAVTNLWHERVQLDEPKRQLLLLLDGAKPKEQIEQIWRVAVEYGARTGNDAKLKAQIDRLDFEDELAWLARAALMIQS